MRRERKNIRLGNFDYRSEGYHYVTICIKDRECYLGRIQNKVMNLSPAGKIADLCWRNIPNHFPHVLIDEFVIMPNHMHGIIKLDYSIMHTSHGETPTGTCRGEKQIGTCHGMTLLSNHIQLSKPQQIRCNKFGRPVSGSVSMIINHFKSAVKRWCNKNGNDYFFWQPRFYDHIINNQKDLIRIRKYIKLNPAEWDPYQRLTK